MAWSRQTYFAAIVPRDGIVLKHDTQLVAMPMKSLSELGACDHQQIDGGQQYLGLLQPRQQSQFSITNPIRKLSVLRRDSETDEKIKAKGIINAMDTDWKLAFFIDESRQAWVAKDTAPNGRANFEPIEQ